VLWVLLALRFGLWFHHLSPRILSSPGVLEIRETPRNGQQYVVGIISAYNPDEGLSYGNVLSREVLDHLARLAANFDADSYGYRYPQPSAQLPDGAPNPASINYPTYVPGAGPSTTVYSSRGNGNGFFSINYPTAPPRDFVQFDDPGGCG